MAIAALALTGCGEAKTMEQTEGGAAVPAFVQAMIDADFPADGKVHVQRRGRIAFTARSMFCAGAPIVSPALRSRGVQGAGLVGAAEHIRKLGQPLSSDGSVRFGLLHSKHCPANDVNVAEQALVLLNRQGRPYRLVLALWQGQAGWVGTVERGESGPRPEVFNPYGNDPLSREVTFDTETISSKFLSELSEGE